MQRYGFTDEVEFVEDIPFNETRGYVKRVLGSYDRYQTLYGAPRSEKREPRSTSVKSDGKGKRNWQEKTPMPTPRGYAGAAVSGGKVHVIGGYDGVRALSINEVYFPERDNGQDQAWSEAKSMPASRYAMGTAAVADIIHIVGGMGQVKENQQTLVYFPNQDEWLASADTVSGEWSDLGLATIETRLYGIGGSVAGEVSGQNLSYQAIYTISLPLVR